MSRYPGGGETQGVNFVVCHGVYTVVGFADQQFSERFSWRWCTVIHVEMSERHSETKGLSEEFKKA